MDTLSVPATMTVPAVVSSFQSYVNYARSIPMLSEEEEKQLFHEYQTQNSLEAAKQIIMSHLRFVVHIAHTYKGYGLAMEDVVQEGNIGLMKSVKRFDLSHGVRFATFAVHWIKSEINEFVLKNWRIVKVASNKARRKLFFNLRSLKQNLSWLNDEEASNVAKELGVDVADVRAVECSLHQNDKYFDSTFGEPGDNEGPDCAYAKLIEDHSQAPEMLYLKKTAESSMRDKITKALSQLDERSRDIVESRFLQSHEAKLNLEELGEKYGVSAERIRQIELKALGELRTLIGRDEYFQA